MNRDGRLAQIATEARKATRNRKFHWCRRENGFCDLPIWRLVASRLRMPLYQVVAFANRLEELANAAANFGEVRGNVGRFNADEFAMALGMSVDDAARIFAELALPEIGWIAYDHVADFYDRNPDRIDEGAADRKRRQRMREKIVEQLGRMAREGSIPEAERRSVENALNGTLDELRELQGRLGRMELDAHLPPAQLSTGVSRHVTRDIGGAGGPQKHVPTASDVTRDVTMSRCDIVTVTPEESKSLSRSSGDNFGSSGRVEPAGWPNVEVTGAVGRTETPLAAEEDEDAKAERWLATTGVQLVRDRMGSTPAQAQLKIAEWTRKLPGGAPEAVELLCGVNAAADPTRPALFHVMIVDAIARRQQEAEGPRLPLIVPIQGRAGGAA